MFLSFFLFQTSPAGTVEVTLDTDKGTLSFADLETSHGNYGVAFSNLKGISLRPAFSLYSADDSITLLTGKKCFVYMHIYIQELKCIVCKYSFAYLFLYKIVVVLLNMYIRMYIDTYVYKHS